MTARAILVRRAFYAASRHPCGGAWRSGLASASVYANRRSEPIRATVAIAMRDRLLAAVRQEASVRARDALMRARRCVVLLVAAVAGCARSSGSPTDADAEALPQPIAHAGAEARAALVNEASDGFLDVPGAADLARPGDSPVLIQVRRSKKVGSSCSGGGCSSDLDARSMGVLPARSFGWFWPDRARRPTAKGCPDVPELGSLFRTWTMIEISPAAGTLTRGGHCGLGVNADGGVRYWVIVRIGPSAPG